MGSNESYIHYPTYKNDYCYNSEIISSNVENITAIFHIVCRWKHLFQICMIRPLGSFYSLNPFV